MVRFFIEDHACAGPVALLRRPYRDQVGGTDLVPQANLRTILKLQPATYSAPHLRGHTAIAMAPPPLAMRAPLGERPRPQPLLPAAAHLCAEEPGHLRGF